MKQYAVSLLTFLCSLQILTSCDKNDCEDIACFTPPQNFYFEVLDASELNLSSTTDFNLNDVSIYNTTYREELQVDTLNLEGKILFTGTKLGWEQVPTTYSFSYRENELFSIFVDAERVREDCCSFSVYNSFEINGANAEKVNSRALDNLYRVNTDYRN